MAARKRVEADTKASPAKKDKTEEVDQEVTKETASDVVSDVVNQEVTVEQKEAVDKQPNPDSTVDEDKGTKDKLEPQPVPKATTRTRSKVISITITNLTKNMVRLGSLTIPAKNEEAKETGVLVVTETNKIYSIMRSPIVTNLQRVGWIKVETKN